MRLFLPLIVAVCMVYPVYAEEAPAARAVLDRLDAAVNAIEADLPAITRAAEEAAGPFMAGQSVALRGDDDMLRQLNDQPGGFMTPFVATGDVGFTPKAYAEGALAAPTRSIAAWVYACELFAAVTRQGQAPVLRMHRDFDGTKRWLRQYRTSRLHEDIQLQPIAPGVLGKRYLEALRGVLRDVGTASWAMIARTSRRSANTVLDGRAVFIRSPRKLEDPMNLFTRLDHSGEEPGKPIPGQGDFMIAIGSDEEPGSLDWGDTELFRQATRGVAWVVGGYERRPRQFWTLEILIDQQWPVGQALVKVEGYKPRLGNVTGIVADAIQIMLTEQTGAIVAEQRAADRRAPMKAIEPVVVPAPAAPKPAEPKPLPYPMTRR